jgi:multidrug efflux pump subunit AcrA (membrane-fusion protein)
VRTVKRWSAVVIGLVVVVVTGITLTGQSRPAEVSTIIIQPTHYVRRVTADGQLKAVQSTPLTVTVRRMGAYHQMAWLIPEGERVDTGDVVARLDPTELEQELQDGYDDGRIAEAKIHKAEAERERTLDQLNRDAELSRHELDLAQRFQATDTSLYSKMEIVKAATDTELAQQRTDHAERNKVIRDEHSRTDLELLDIEQRKADLKVTQAQEGLMGLEIRAPHPGLVIHERDWRGNTIEVGETVWAGRVVANLPDLSEMEAEVFVLEADAGGVAEGQRATVVVEAHPEVVFNATVKAVDPVAQTRRRSPVQYFRTVLALEHTDTELMKPGQTVHAEIIIEEHDDAVAIPRQSVYERDGRTVVYRRDGDEFVPVEVTVSAAGLGRVVISSGLSPGDEIALRDPSASDIAGGGSGSSAGAGVPGGIQ